MRLLDSLFTAQPDLDAKSACSWSPQEPRYDIKAFALALRPLLDASSSLRKSSSYRYDLVDVARQVVANQSRVLLPQIKVAYSARDVEGFRKLTQQWLEHIEDLNQITGTEPSLLFGRWLARARAAARTPQEQAQLEFDATSLLLEWGPESSRVSGVHDYASREWSGLLEFYAQRWKVYFSTLAASLQSGEPAHQIDWFAINQEYAKEKKQYPQDTQGDSFTVVDKIYQRQQA